MGVLSFLGATERQLNPLDNGATAKNAKGNGQKQSTAAQAGNAAVGIAKGIASPFAWLVKTDIVNPLKSVSGQVTGNDKAYQHAEADQTKNATPMKFLGNTAQIAADVLLPGVGKFVESGVEKLAPKIVPTVVKKIVTGSATGAPAGVVYNEAGLAADGQPFTKENIEKAAKSGASSGALLGALFGAGGEAATRGIKAVIPKVHADYTPPTSHESSLEAPLTPSDLHDLSTATDVQGVQKILAGKIDPAIIDKVAPAIAQTKDPGVIDNIITRASQPTLAEIQQRSAPSRPNASLQSQIEDAHNAGDTNKVIDLINQLPPDDQPSMRSALGIPNNYLTNRMANPKPEPAIETAPVDTSVAPKTLSQDVSTKAPDEAINKHLQTISNAQSTTPELQEAIKGLKQTHEIRDTQKLSDDAKASVDKDYTGSLTKVLTNESPSDKDVALGEQLIVKAQRDGKTGEAVNIAETLDRNLREHGRAVQAASIIGRLSPEGQLLRATRIIRKVRESNPENITKEQNAAKEIRRTLDEASPAVDKTAIHQAVKEITNDQQKLDLGGAQGPDQAVDNTGKALAKNVEKAVTPVIKKKADALVAELTKKVKQEYLPIPGHVMKSPLQTLREVFARHGEAEEAYPLAQQILREKYANVPRMQEALDKFFGSKLDMPAASSTVDRAIMEQLRTNHEKISDIIYKSAQEQKATVESIANKLVEQGFDKESASSLVKEVSRRLDQRIADAKQTTLERLSQDVKGRNQPTYLEKVHKLSNLGALDDHDYLQLARAKLDLPHLKEETASKISELSQKLQDLPEGHDKYAAVRELQHVISADIPRTKIQLVKELAGLPRTILSSGDFSFGARQGLVYATSHPVTFIKAWPKQFEYFKQAFKGKDSEAYDAMMADVRSHPDYNLLEKYGRLLEPTGHDVNSRSEQFLSSDLAEKIPLAGRLVRGSNYAFAGLSNTLYANQFYGMLDHLRYADIKPTEPMLKQIAEVVGTSLGRGGKAGGFTEKHAGFLSTSLFAPRLIASRLNVMNPAYYIRLKGAARQEALRGFLGLSAFAVATLGAAKLGGAQVSIDPRSADFGKIRVGDTRFDVLGGFTQYIRLGAQLSTGQKINSTSGAETEVGKGTTGSRLDIASNFIQGKENPTVSFVTDLLKGKDISGNSIYNPKGITKEVIQRFIPLLAQDMADLATHPNSAGPAAGVAGLFGVGLQTYGTQDVQISKKQNTYIEQLKKDGAPADKIKASQLFYQTIKTVPPKTQVYGEIDAALTAGNQDKAIQLAKDYNAEFSKAFDKWRQQYPQYRSDSTLTASYVSRQITDDELQSRIDKLNSGGS